MLIINSYTTHDLRLLVCRVHTKLGAHFATVALPMAGVILLTVTLMEVFIPWTEDLEIYVSSALIGVFWKHLMAY